MKKFLLSLFALVLVLGLGSTVFAETFTYDRHDKHISISGWLYTDKDGQNIIGYKKSSFIHMKGSNGSSVNALMLDSYTPFALPAAEKDLYNSTYSINKNANLSDYAGGDKNLSAITRMAEILMPKINNADDTYASYYQAVLQAAIWEIRYDGVDNFMNKGHFTEMNFGNGNFYLTHFIDYANGNGLTIHPETGVELAKWMQNEMKLVFKEAMSDNYVDKNSVEFYLLQNSSLNGPHLLGFNYTPAATPIPAAAWLLGSGIAGMVGIRRKFKK